MKTAWLAVVLAFAACRGKPKEEGREPAQQPPPAPAPAPAPVPAPTPGSAVGSGSDTGSAAGSAAGSGSAVVKGVECAAEIAIVCDKDAEDGCTGGRTTIHACVPKGAKAGPPCTQEIAAKCPAGQADACMQTPPPSKNHVCVIVKAAP